MAGNFPISQDWEPVVIQKKALTAAARKDEKAVNVARSSGAEIETIRKSTAGTNKAASSGTSSNTKKLAEDTENLAHEKVPTELKKNIMQARMDTGARFGMNVFQYASQNWLLVPDSE